MNKEGWIFFIPTIILTIISFPFFPIIGFFLLILSFCFFYFFRDPVRIIPNEDVIVAPADGKIVYIGVSTYPEESKISGNCLKVSIFLDLYNVHVNRIPISGTIKEIIYVPGKFFRANVDKSSKENERNIIIIEDDKKQKIVVSQIAGLVARRIVCDLKVNQQVIKGNRFGIIKFGSRVDLFLPEKHIPIILEGQTIIGGETIISNPNNIKTISNYIKI